MRNQEHPMAQRGLLGFPMELETQKQQQKAQDNSQLKIQPVARSARKEVDRSLQAIKAKWPVLPETKPPALRTPVSLGWLVANLSFFSLTVSCARGIHLKFKNSNWILTIHLPIY
ncbi:hypothetical protein Zmor_001177 [Zophobas morio]|uniref:Uncharacterized protein n=1 Tax=Zophobas morio TaxID=2755281 RepID=A0AA38MRA6_9CUCU|nr:hypothetical protein Zmor_001177 [Zophobas morio]